MSLQDIRSLPTGQVGETNRRASKGYAAVLHEVSEDPRLLSRDVHVVAVLLKYAQQKSFCWPSNATLAREVRACVRTVQASMARLIAAGWISTWTSLEDRKRYITLVWREKPANPLPAYSQGMPRSPKVAPPPMQSSPSTPVQPVAIKEEPGREKEVRLSPLDSKRPGDRLIATMGEAERKAFFAGLNLPGLSFGRPSSQIASKGLSGVVFSPKVDLWPKR